MKVGEIWETRKRGKVKITAIGEVGNYLVSGIPVSVDEPEKGTRFWTTEGKYWYQGPKSIWDLVKLVSE